MPASPAFYWAHAYQEQRMGAILRHLKCLFNLPWERKSKSL
jgi:hypothetical protein